MRTLLAWIATALLIAITSPALANPVGSYDVVGQNPDSGGQYRGTVTVSRTGTTYKVVWKIAGTSYTGTALGATIRDGRFRIGEAEAADVALSIGYVSGRSFGVAFYIEQDDGSWQGVWTYAGSRDVSSETWRRR